MVGDHFAANIADMVFVRIVVQARISALAAHAVRPLMIFTRHDHSAAAAPFLLVNVSGPCRPLLRTALMVGGVLFAVGLMTVLAYCLGGAGSRTAGVRTVSVLCGIIILHITIGVDALMPMMRCIVLPCLIPTVTARLNRLVFFKAAFVAGKYSVALRQAGRRYGHLSIVPNMRVLLVPCITAGAFLPMSVPVMMPYGCGEIVPQSRDCAAADRAGNGIRAGELRGVAGVVALRPYRRRLGILKHRLRIIKPCPAAENISCFDGVFGRKRRLLSAQNSLRIHRAAAVGVEGQITACAVMDNRSAVCHPSVINAADHIASFQIDPAVKGSAFYGSAVIDHSAVKYAAENEALIRHLGADTDSVRRGKTAGFSDDKLPDKFAAVHKQLTGRHLDIPDGSPCVAVGYGQRARVCIKFRFVRSAHAADGVSVQADLHPVGHKIIGVGFQKHIARQIVVSCRSRKRIRHCPRCPHERRMHRMPLRRIFSAADAVRVDLTFDHDLA